MTTVLQYIIAVYSLIIILIFFLDLSKWKIDLEKLGTHLLVLGALFVIFLVSSFIGDFLIPRIKGGDASKKRKEEIEKSNLFSYRENDED